MTKLRSATHYTALAACVSILCHARFAAASPIAAAHGLDGPYTGIPQARLLPRHGGYVTPFPCFENDIEYYGPDLLKVQDGTVVHPQSCQHKCSETPGCAFWTYIPETAACFLKSNAAAQARKRRPSAVSGPRVCATPHQSCYEADTDYHGYDELMFVDHLVRSPEECRLVCLAFPQCKFWTWVSSQRNCYLKSRHARHGRTHVSGSVSGPRECTGISPPPATGLSLQKNVGNSGYEDNCYEHGIVYNGAAAAGYTAAAAPKDCQYLCQHHPSCRSFSFLLLERQCMLYPTSGVRTADANAVSGPKFCLTPRCVTENTEYYGKTLVATNTTSLGACHELCQFNHLCSAVTFSTDTQLCTLLQRAAVAPTFVSGPKRCAASDRHTRRGVAGATVPAVHYVDVLGESFCYDPAVAHAGKPFLSRHLASSELCQRHCRARMRCRFFSYFAFDKTCLLYESEGQRVPNGLAVSGPRTCPYSACPYGSIEVYGKEAGRSTTENAITCQAQCQNNKRCSFFVYDNGSKLCFQREHQGHASGTVSAPLYCDVPDDDFARVLAALERSQAENFRSGELRNAYDRDAAAASQHGQPESLQGTTPLTARDHNAGSPGEDMEGNTIAGRDDRAPISGVCLAQSVGPQAAGNNPSITDLEQLEGAPVGAASGSPDRTGRSAVQAAEPSHQEEAKRAVTHCIENEPLPGVPVDEHMSPSSYRHDSRAPDEDESKGLSSAHAGSFDTLSKETERPPLQDDEQHDTNVESGTTSFSPAGAEPADECPEDFQSSKRHSAEDHGAGAALERSHLESIRSDEAVIVQGYDAGSADEHQGHNASFRRKRDAHIPDMYESRRIRSQTQSHSPPATDVEQDGDASIEISYGDGKLALQSYSSQEGAESFTAHHIEDAAGYSAFPRDHVFTSFFRRESPTRKEEDNEGQSSVKANSHRTRREEGKGHPSALMGSSATLPGELGKRPLQDDEEHGADLRRSTTLFKPAETGMEDESAKDFQSGEPHSAGDHDAGAAAERGQPESFQSSSVLKSRRRRAGWAAEGQVKKSCTQRKRGAPLSGVRVAESVSPQARSPGLPVTPVEPPRRTPTTAVAVPSGIADGGEILSSRAADIPLKGLVEDSLKNSRQGVALSHVSADERVCSSLYCPDPPAAEEKKREGFSAAHTGSPAPRKEKDGGRPSTHVGSYELFSDENGGAALEDREQRDTEFDRSDESFQLAVTGTGDESVDHALGIDCFNIGSYYDSVALADITVQTTAACQQKCQEDALCSFFSFFRDSGRCTLHLTAGNRMLKPEAVSGPWICSSGARREFCLVLGEYLGEVLNGKGLPSTSVTECFLLCRAHQSCNFFSFHASQHTCKLYKEVDMLRAAVTSVSGPRSCVTTEANPCFQNGIQCTGQETDARAASSAQDCLKACKENVSCNFYSFDKATKSCSLLGNDRRDSKGESALCGSKHCLSPSFDPSCFHVGTRYNSESRIVHARSLPECYQACGRHATCRFFSFLVEEQICHLHELRGTMRGEEGAIAGALYCSVSFHAEYCLMKSFRYVGDVAETRDDANTPLACQTMCAARSECRFFTYAAHSKTCTLLRSRIRLVPDLDSTSGWRKCPDMEACTAAVEVDAESNALFSLRTDSFHSCNESCLRTDECSVAAYDRQTRKCYLAPLFDVLPGALSGLLSCNAEASVIWTSLWGGQRPQEGLPSADSCFKQNRRYSGTSSDQVTAVSVDTCQRVCQGRAGCRFFSYRAMERRCHLYETSSSLVAEDASVSASAWCSPPPLRCIVENVTPRGKSILETKTKTSDACVEVCSAHSDATYFMFDTLTGRCACGFHQKPAKKRETALKACAIYRRVAVLPRSKHNLQAAQPRVWSTGGGYSLKKGSGPTESKNSLLLQRVENEYRAQG